MSVPGDANGMRTQRTNGETTYTYVYDGGLLSQMTVDGNTLRFTYDTNGAPLTLIYNGNTYFYVTNLQGDVISILDSEGTIEVSYTYDAWGNILSVSGSSTLATLNPLRYRGYVYDIETNLYYLQSRYYNPEWGRFISADSLDVLTATPMALTDKNLFAYCDNNPVMREDSDGEFWFVSILIGVVVQYVEDVVTNIINGETGIDIFKPTSSLGEYIAAGVTSIIPGSGLGGAIVRNVVSEGIVIAEAAINGDGINVIDSIVSIGFESVLDLPFERLSNNAVDWLSSKKPQGFASYAQIAQKRNPNLTLRQVHDRMHLDIKLNELSGIVVTGGLNAIRGKLTN